MYLTSVTPYNIAEKYGDRVHLTLHNVIFNDPIEPVCQVVNFIVLLGKQYVFRMKCQNQDISIHEFIAELDIIQDIEYSIAKQNKKVHRHCRMAYSIIRPN